MGRTAIVLAAGKGERLRPVTDSVPKCMVTVDGTPLIERSLDALKTQGVTDVVVVTGYRAETMAHLPAMMAPMKVELLYNPEYATANNIYSLWVAREHATDGFMLLNSDIIYHPDILASSLSTAGTHLIVDDSREMGEEEMKVTLSGGRIDSISKLLDPPTSAGEFIGMMYMDAAASSRLISTIGEMVEAEELDCFYEHAIDRICREVPIESVSTRALPWTEIDTHEDLAFAEAEVAPRIPSPVA